jgi:hypothetical protein
VAGLIDSLKRQNFGPNDSLIASTAMHPVDAAKRLNAWLETQMNIGMGKAQTPTDEADIYARAPTDWERLQAALNIAGVAQTGSIPFAPRSSGGILGTFVNSNKRPASMTKKELQAAHKIAQANAALPVEQGGLGLPPNNTAIDRAKALGFFTEKQVADAIGKNRDYAIPPSNDLKTFYHGGPKDFDMSGFKESSGSSFYDPSNIKGGYAFLTSSKGEAKGYADELKLKKNIPSDIHEFFVRKDNETKVIPSSTGKNLPSYKDLEEKGFGQTIVDLGKYGKGSDDKYYQHEWVLPYKPEQIRSTKAAFDPMKRNSLNLLASGLIGSLILNRSGLNND